MPLFEHAVVIGGSIAGNLAARVLADHAVRVTVIERDRYPGEIDHRAGVPQSYHVHALLLRGAELMEALIPGFGDELVRQGGQRGELLRQSPTFLHGNWVPLPKRDLPSFSASRLLVETVLREQVMRRWPQIAWETEQRVVDLIVADGRVTGVEVQAAHDPDQRRTISADLVVDASGRNSALPRWLERLGRPMPPQTVVDSKVGYATRWFEPPASARSVPWQIVIVRGESKPTMRSCFLAVVERNRWIVTLAGCGGDYPPIDEAGFLAFAKSLPRPIIADAIERGRPLAPIQGYRAMENRNRHYERHATPDGLVVLGDAFCSLNPVYGQGMTMATIGVDLFRRWLEGADTRPGWSNRFHRKLAGAYALPWLMATGEDYRVPGVQGPPPPRALKLVHRYLDAVLHASSNNGDVWRTFAQVAQLTRHPANLLRPGILWAVVRRGARGSASLVRPTPVLPLG